MIDARRQTDAQDQAARNPTALAGPDENQSNYDTSLDNSGRTQDGAVVLFDGVCNMCNGTVRFIIARDPAARFHFAALESDAARRVLAGSDVSGPLPDSVVLVEQGRVYTRSTAALRIARRLRFPWPLMSAFLIVPRPLRDLVFDFIARHRYRWFGKRDACMLPTPDLRKRFLE